MASFLHIKEGTTQGYPLAMVTYGIVIIPLTNNLKLEFPDVYQPWYAGDASALGMFENVKLYFNSLKNDFTRDMDIIPNHLKVSWLCTRKY